MLENILEERGKRYGEFVDNANVSVGFRKVIADYASNIDEAEPYMIEAINMILHKLARITNGDPYYKDSWVDIAGYAQLVVNELQKEEI